MRVSKEIIFQLGLCLTEWLFCTENSRQFITHRDSDACISRDGLCIFAVRLNVNVKAVFSTNRISNLVNEGKHVFALTPCGNLTFVLPEMVI